MQEGMCSTPAWVFLNGTNILQYRHHFIVTVAFQMSFRFIRVLISNSLLRFTWNFQVMMGSWSSPLVVVRHRDWLFCNSENPPFSSLLHLQRCYQIISLSRSLLSPSDFLFPLSLSLCLCLSLSLSLSLSFSLTVVVTEFRGREIIKNIAISCRESLLLIKSHTVSLNFCNTDQRCTLCRL